MGMGLRQGCELGAQSLPKFSHGGPLALIVDSSLSNFSMIEKNNSPLIECWVTLYLGNPRVPTVYC